MKKKVLLTILILIVGVLFVGCEKEDETIKNPWMINVDIQKQYIDDNVKKVFEDAIEKYDGNLDYVALLGKQVVAGTNYMFLCKDNAGYKVAIIYKDLEGTSQITKVFVFDPVKYVDKETNSVPTQLVGGWYTEVPEEIVDIDPKIKIYFNEANEKLVGGNYFPIGVVAEKYESGSYYALLSYGELSYEGATPGVYMLTLYVDENKDAEIVSISNINLSDFNK